MKDSTRELMELLAWHRQHTFDIEPNAGEDELRALLAEHYRRLRQRHSKHPGILRVALKRVRDWDGGKSFP